jgi:hypothetical protein
LIQLKSERFCKPKVGSSILSTGTIGLADNSANQWIPARRHNHKRGAFVISTGR